MRKYLVLALIAGSLILTACGTKEESIINDSQEVAIGDGENTETVTEEEIEDTSSEGSVEVDETLFNVELTIPAAYLDENVTQADLDEICKENGYKSITLNSDGTATYVMSKKQHKEMMEEYKTSIRQTLDEMIGSEDYPNVTAIETNDDFTKFTVTTTSTELSLSESFSVLTYYIAGGMYNVFNGTPVDNIVVEFVNADTGEILQTCNSKDMANE